MGAIAAVALLVFPGAASVTKAEPANLSPHKREIARYVATGEYDRDLAAVAESAKKYLLRRITQAAKPGEKPAIVFDIDETLLSNVGHMTANDYGYIPRLWAQWVEDGRAPAILPVQAIYEVTVRAGIDIFLITGRTESERAATERNLRRAGYETWTRMICQPEKPGAPPSNSVFKTEARRALTEEGYTIIANIGDQESDLANGYAERTFKLPNPFYQYD